MDHFDDVKGMLQDIRARQQALMRRIEHEGNLKDLFCAMEQVNSQVAKQLEEVEGRRFDGDGWSG